MATRGRQRQRAADFDLKEVEAARIEPDAQRRPLDLLNGARRPNDLGGLDRAEIGPELARKILATVTSTQEGGDRRWRQ